MNSAKQNGTLSVDTLIALQEGKLHVQLPCGSFKVVHHSYQQTGGCKVYDNNLLVEMVVILQPEGQRPSFDRSDAFRSKISKIDMFADRQAN